MNPRLLKFVTMSHISENYGIDTFGSRASFYDSCVISKQTDTLSAIWSIIPDGVDKVEFQIAMISVVNTIAKAHGTDLEYLVAGFERTACYVAFKVKSMKM